MDTMTQGLVVAPVTSHKGELMIQSSLLREDLLTELDANNNQESVTVIPLLTILLIMQTCAPLSAPCKWCFIHVCLTQMLPYIIRTHYFKQIRLPFMVRRLLFLSFFGVGGGICIIHQTEFLTSMRIYVKAKSITLIPPKTKYSIYQFAGYIF